MSEPQLKLPPFTLQNPAMWFRRAEVQFRLKGVKSSATMADYTLNAMSEDTFQKLDSWIADKPAKLDYVELKNYILDRFTMKITERAQRILQLAGVPLGDQTASEAWDEISCLASVPQTSGELPKKVSLKREIFLQRLPDRIRRALPDAERMDMQVLVREADKLIMADKATTTGGVSVDAVNAVHTPAPAEQLRRRPQLHSRKNEDLNDQDLCFYHATFGEKALKCRPGCVWPKNGPSGRRQ